MPVTTSSEGPPSAHDTIWDRPWIEVDHVVLDLETTGNEVASARICEVAWERRDARGRTIDRFESLVHAEVAVGASQAIHGIDDAALALAPTLTSLAPRLREALSSAILVGHRIAYDLSFLSAAAERGEIERPDLHALDTKKLAQRVTHGVPTSLAGLAELYELPRPSHRALPDVIATVALFDRLLDELRPSTARDLWVAQSLDGPALIRDDVRDVITRAVAMQRVVRVRYRVPGRAAVDAELEPWVIVGAHVEGMLVAKGRRVLRGDRILRAELSDRVFVPPTRWTSSLPITP
jgi:DNA polymerase-3 subunit epsilon